MKNNKILINDKEIKIANEFIKLKKEELTYIDNIAKISSNKILSEYEKIEIHRTLNNFKNELTDLSKKLFNELIKRKEQLSNIYDDSIIEFDIDKSFLSSLKFKYEEQEKYVLNGLGINENTLTFKLTLKDLIWKYNRYGYKGINSDTIQNKQRLIENPIYIFCGYYDSSEDCYGPCFGDPESYIYGIYENICNSAYNNDEKEVAKKHIKEFEKDKIIIHSKRYVHSHEIRKIFEEELLNSKNQTLNDCVTQTRNRIEELNYTRSPEYKEKVLLDRIKELNKKNEKEFIKKEILYSDEFDITKEKNNTKNSIIIIGITQDKEYIITSQKKIKDKLTAGFPSGHTKDNEDVIESAKRLLKENVIIGKLIPAGTGSKHYSNVKYKLESEQVDEDALDVLEEQLVD